MNFLNQVRAEVKNMSLSKFIVISAAIFFLFVVVGLPVLGMIFEDSYTYYPYDQEYVIVDGVEYENDNDFTHEYTYLQNDAEYIGQMFSGDALKHATEVSDRILEMLATAIPYAAQSERDYDYRERLFYEARQNIIDIYVLQQPDLADEALAEGVNWFGYSEYLEGEINNGGAMYNYGYGMPDASTTEGEEPEEFVPLTESEKQELIIELQAEIDTFYEIMETDNYTLYAEIRKEEYQEQIKNYTERIEQLEKDIIETPSQEELISEEIKNLEESIIMVNEINIPQLEFRLANNIIEGDGSWQDSALSGIEQLHWRIQNATDVYTEQEYEQNQWMADQYGTYQDYLTAMEKEKQQFEEELFVAESSLNANKPDMEFVSEGARTVFYNTFFPTATMMVAIFAMLVGGWCLASEFQNGTVRLMMIRPRTRTKVLLSRYVAGLVVVFMLYLAFAIALLVVSGFRGGFGDYFYPNYSATGQVNFFISMLGDFFIVFFSIVFLYTVAFMISGVVRNTAVAIIIPTVMYVGALIGLNILAYQPPIDILAYTPIPYLLLQDYVNMAEYGYVKEFLSKGMPVSIGLGAAVLVICSIICLAIVGYVFKKRDITN